MDKKRKIIICTAVNKRESLTLKIRNKICFVYNWFPQMVTKVTLPLNQMVIVNVTVWLLIFFLFKNILKGLDFLFVFKASAKVDSSAFWSMNKWSSVRDNFILFRIILGHFHSLLQQAASLGYSSLEHMVVLLCTEWNHTIKL